MCISVKFEVPETCKLSTCLIIHTYLIIDNFYKNLKCILKYFITCNRAPARHLYILYYLLLHHCLLKIYYICIETKLSNVPTNLDACL